MTDRIDSFGNSLIQHGKHSDRVYLMKLSGDDLPELPPYMDSLARLHGYTKIFAKVPEHAEWQFRRHDFRIEAAVPDFYRGEEDVTFMGKYYVPDRVTETRPRRVREVIEAARGKQADSSPGPLDQGLNCRRLQPADAEAMAGVYQKVFASYPFPIHDPAYLRRTMASHVTYRGVFEGDRLISVASAELDREGKNAEMTDFATLPEERGRGLAAHLLAELETAAAASGILTAYTIARAYSFAMNITFAKAGYAFAGTLTRNTQIAGELESMNVWYKSLAGRDGARNG
jgi:putative beta-lysine N-acetyltransferase